MRIFFFILSVFIFESAASQEPVFIDEDYYKREINKNIFRGMMTFLLPGKLRFTVCYEHELINPFTVILKAGPSIFVEDPSLNDEIELAATASGELRYYFNLKRKIKKDKITRNFSAGYFSLEPFVISKSLVLFDDPDHEERRKTTTGVYSNIGFQRQVKRNYVAAFFGIRFGAKEDTEMFDIIQAGFVIGRVF